MKPNNVNKVSFTSIALFISTAVLASVPLTAGAQSTLVNIGVDPNADFSGYLNTLYAIAIAVAALLAVLKIVIAGVKYMTSDIVTSKADAKRDIQGAIFGLLIVMSAMLILTIINPALTGGSIGGNISQLQAVNAVPTAAPAAALTVPVNTGGGGGVTYSYVETADTDQQAAFVATCTVPPQIVAYRPGNRVRCYNTVAGQAVDHSPICSARARQCTASQRNLTEERCIGDTSDPVNKPGLGTGGAGSQSYIRDPDDNKVGICIYDQ
jgi:hypothetical protein